MEFCFWTLVRDYTDYFSNANVKLLKVEFDINPEERSEKNCVDRALGAVNAALDRDWERCAE